MSLLGMLAVNMKEWPKVNGEDVALIGQATDGTLHYDNLNDELIGRSEEQYPQPQTGKFFIGMVNKKQWLDVQTWDGVGLPHIGSRVKIKDDGEAHKHYKDHIGKELIIVGHTTQCGEVCALYKCEVKGSVRYSAYVFHAVIPDILEPYDKLAVIRSDINKKVCK